MHFVFIAGTPRSSSGYAAAKHADRVSLSPAKLLISPKFSGNNFLCDYTIDEASPHRKPSIFAPR